LLDGYLDAKSVLAEAFRQMMVERIEPRMGALTGIAEGLNEYAAARYGSELPREYLAERRPGSTHRLLYAYLSLFPGTPVNAQVIRVLTGDAVHTERRLRELRDWGVVVEARDAAAGDCYVLDAGAPDYRTAAAMTVRRNIRADKNLDNALSSNYLTRASNVDGLGSAG
jgi:hypothetical protein